MYTCSNWSVNPLKNQSQLLPISQVITKEQQLVCPSQGAPAQRDLPVGIRADAVQSAGTMALALKQVVYSTLCLTTAHVEPVFTVHYI